MTLFILATCVLLTVQGQMLTGERVARNSVEKLVFNLVGKQLQGKELDCATNVYNAHKSGKGWIEIADNVLPQCGFTDEEMDAWVSKIERITASVTGEKIPERHTLSAEEVAEITHIDPKALEAEKQAVAAAIAPQTGGFDPMPSTFVDPAVSNLVDPMPSAFVDPAFAGPQQSSLVDPIQTGLLNAQVDNAASGPHGLFSMQ